mgnify:CR=1 FL=1
MNIYQAIKKVLDNGWFILGEEVKAFEKEVADYYHKKYAIGVNSGTDALLLSLEACGIKKGDEVITTPFTFISPAEVIARCGATPVFVDINYRDFLIDSLLIGQAINEKTKAIMPVHLFGQCCDMGEIMRIAKEYGLYVIEDAAQAFGNKNIGKGDLLCFSFHPSKSLGACGDAGIVLTNNKKLADKIESLRNHGADLSKGAIGKYHNLYLGYNSRLDEIQAAILRVKFQEFKKQPIKRLYTFRTPNRDLVQQYLDKMGIDNKIYYSKPLHLLPVFKYLGYEKGSFPITEEAGKEVLSIVIYE